MDLTPFTLDPSSKTVLIHQGGPIFVHTQVDLLQKAQIYPFSQWACIYSLI